MTPSPTRSGLPAVSASPAIAAQAARLGDILQAVPPEATEFVPAPWATALYLWTRGVVHPGRELDAVDYVVRNRRLVERGDLGLVELRAKVVASFKRDEHDPRWVLTERVPETPAPALPLASLCYDESDVVRRYFELATGIRMSGKARRLLATGVNVAVEAMLVPPSSGPRPADPLRSLQNGGRAAERGARLTDRLQALGVPPTPARSLARMLTGTGRQDRTSNSLLRCAATRAPMTMLDRATRERWAADAIDLEQPTGLERARNRRVARQAVSVFEPGSDRAEVGAADRSEMTA